LEAEKRGLANVRTTPHALDAMMTKKAIDLYTKTGVFTKREIEARHEILLEDYIKKIQIESRIIGDMALTKIVPAAVSYQSTLASNLKNLKELGISSDSLKGQLDLLERTSKHINTIIEKVEAMRLTRKRLNEVEDARERAIGYCDEVKPFFDEIRYHADKLELIVDDELWPLPKYRELLFIK
jgi:glutamine synthetase